MFGQFQVVAVLGFVSLLMSIWIPSTQALTTLEPDTEYVEEVATELFTEMVAITTEQTSREDEKEETDQKSWPDYPGDTFMAVKFCITNRNLPEEDKDQLEDEIQKEVSAICQHFEFFLSVIVINMKPGSVIVEAAILFDRKTNREEEDLVMQTLYEAVEINGTLGTFEVEELYAIDERPGNYRRIQNACDIEHCANDKMTCSSEGIKCFSTCEDNKDYCLNNATCVDKTSDTNFIGCRCADGYKGYQCEIPPRPRSRPYSENVFIGIITAAAVVLFFLLLLLACLLCSRIRKRKSEYRTDIYPVENVIALEMSNDYFIVGGVGCQTDDSFLLTQYMRNGIPPKAGCSHSVMQTTDSFLLAKSQGRPYVRKGKTAPAPTAPTPTKNGATHNVSSAVDAANGPDKKQTIEKVNKKVPDAGVDNNGAFNEGFIEDENSEPPKKSNETDDDLMRDPKKIVKV